MLLPIVGSREIVHDLIIKNFPVNLKNLSGENIILLEIEAGQKRALE